MKRSYLKRKSTWKPKPRGYSWSTLKRGGRIRVKRDARLIAWSKAVRERDGNVCQWPGGCQTGDTRIDPHHLAKRSQRKDLKYEVSNGLLLCRQHHLWTDDNHDEAVAMGLLNTESRELAQRANRDELREAA